MLYIKMNTSNCRGPSCGIDGTGFYINKIIHEAQLSNGKIYILEVVLNDFESFMPIDGSNL